MTNVDLTSITLSLVSITVSLIAIVFSIWFWKDSKQSSKEASTTLIEVKAVAKSIRHDVNDFAKESFRSVLFGKEDQGWRTEMCCSNSEVMRRERRVREAGNIFVSVVTIDYEVRQFVQVIADNLKHGRLYYYFLPKDIPGGGCEGETTKFINTLLSEGVSIEVLKKNLKVMEVKSGEILCNVTLLDPEVGPREGFILPAFDNPERAFSVKLDNTLHDRAWHRVQEWLKPDGATVIWPKPDSPS